MKHIFIYLTAAVACLCAASCQKTLDKHEVENGFAAKDPVPTVTLDMNTYKVVEEEGYAEVNVTYSGVKADMDSLELVILVSLSEDFLSATPVPVDAEADGTYTVQIPVRPAKVNYVKATAATISGSAYSDVLVLDVPEVAWYKMIADSYTADAYSYWDEGSCKYPGYTIGVEAVENEDGTGTVTFTNFDPFAVSNKFESVVVASFDIESRIASIALDEYGMFDAGLGSIGYFCVPLNEEMNPDNHMYVVFSEDYSKMNVQLYGTYNEGWYEVILPTIYSAN